MVYVGIDLGGTNIAVGLVDEGGRILHQGSAPTGIPRPYQDIVADMARVSRDVVAQAGYTMEDVKAVGVGVPGIADPETGVIPFCTNLHWHNVPFRDEFHKHIDKPLFIDNDATVAALAEYVAGVSAGTHSSVFLTLGTGLGGGIIINGKPYSGYHHIGSEIGHTIIALDGEPCTCGNDGCLERYASATALIREARKAYAEHPDSLMGRLCGGDPANISGKVAIDAAKAGDPTALDVFNRYVHGLAAGIISIINFIDPQVIVLGGGVSLAGDFLLNAVREAVRPMVFFKTMPYAGIQLAKLGPDAGIIGAAMLGK
ncbi:MAG: ROK family protein [Oscillospiraceae bacterium]|jgi:glucokinase|nr:ROK family protein [Oscillospiraceae bacterium]